MGRASEGAPPRRGFWGSPPAQSHTLVPSPTSDTSACALLVSDGSVLTPGWGWAVGAPQAQGRSVPDRMRAEVGRGHWEVLPLVSWLPPCPCMVGPTGDSWGAPELGVQLPLPHPTLSLSSLLPALVHSVRFLGANLAAAGPLRRPPPSLGAVSLLPPVVWAGGAGMAEPRQVTGAGPRGMGLPAHFWKRSRWPPEAPPTCLFPDPHLEGGRNGRNWQGPQPATASRHLKAP